MPLLQHLYQQGTCRGYLNSESECGLAAFRCSLLLTFSVQPAAICEPASQTACDFLAGAVGAFLYKNHKVPHSSEQLLFMAGLVFFNVFLGGKQESAIDNLGHLGGLLCGIYVGTLLTPAVIKQPLEESDGEMGSAAAIELDGPRQRSPERATSAKATVVQPDPFQSLVVVLCISLTLSSSVAATVLNRTGELPFPRLPPWLG